MGFMTQIGYRACIFTVGTGENLDQRRFTGPILSDQSVSLALFELEVDVLQHLHARERLIDILETQYSTVHHHDNHRSCRFERHDRTVTLG